MGKPLTLIIPLFFLVSMIHAQTNAKTWTFHKFDKDGNGEITFRELKCNGFFRYDRNGNLKLSIFEFWRLKQYQKKQLRQFERIIRKGVYTQYYRYALEPLITYKSNRSIHSELFKRM